MKFCYFSLIIIVACSISFTCLSCTTIKQLPEEKVIKENTSEFKFAEKVLFSVLKDDYSAFQSMLSPDLKDAISKDVFQKILQEVVDTAGTPVSYQYVTKLKMKSLSPYIWKIYCKKDDKENKKEIITEVLFRVVVASTKEGPFLVSYNFL